MNGNSDLRALLSGGQLDAATVARLAAADPEQMKRSLGRYLPDDEVERILARVRALVEATGKPGSTGPKPDGSGGRPR